MEECLEEIPEVSGTADGQPAQKTALVTSVPAPFVRGPVLPQSNDKQPPQVADGRTTKVSPEVVRLNPQTPAHKQKLNPARVVAQKDPQAL
jgi:hypothetical protein